MDLRRSRNALVVLLCMLLTTACAKRPALTEVGAVSFGQGPSGGPEC